MGEVFKVTQIENSMNFAVKLLTSESSEETQIIEK